MERHFPIWAALGMLMLASGRAATAAYDYQSIDYHGATATYANGINAAGQIVGEYADVNGVTHAFTLFDGEYVNFDVPGAVGFSSANGINADGQIVGLYSDANGTTRGYLRTDDDFQDILPFNHSPFTQALSISDAGHVVGSYVDANNLMQGFRYDGNAFETLSIPGAEAIAVGLNNAGSVVGTYRVGGVDVHGFLMNNGDYATIDMPAAAHSEAQGINDANQVGGLYLSVGYRYYGFVLDEGNFEIIHMPGALESKVFAINNSGQVVGMYLDGQGNTRGFLASPVAPSDVHGVELTDLPNIVVSANSDSGPGGEPGNAIDNLDYEGGSHSWVAGDHAALEDPNWLQLDFGAEFNLASVEVRGIFNGPDNYAGFDNVFNLLASQDGATWAAIGSGVIQDSGRADLRDESFSFAAGSQPVARFLKYEVVGGSHWSYVGEINVQGTLPGDANGDLQVDIVDLNLVRNNFGLSGDAIEGGIWFLGRRVQSLASLDCERQFEEVVRVADRSPR
ncbi:MAG: hypothetical protein SGJ19_04465, partial [Planctomycetia bacterium]|nr:hypothetical protein [Planctomycetia bacterium]